METVPQRRLEKAFPAPAKLLGGTPKGFSGSSHTAAFKATPGFAGLLLQLMALPPFHFLSLQPPIQRSLPGSTAIRRPQQRVQQSPKLQL